MPQNSRISRDGWLRLMAAFGMPENVEMHDSLLAAYSEKHRAYHTLDHIKACFVHLDAVRDQANHPHEIEMALWFHDVIYKPFSGTNEEDSADMAKAFLAAHMVPPEVIARIYDLILLTKDHGVPTSNDGQLMLDIDLSILGADSHIYAQFEKDVRKEYKRVPFFMFKKKRKEILKAFLSRPRIYQTPYFFDRLEKHAKQNLTWAISSL